MLTSGISLNIKVFYVFWEKDIGRVRCTISKHWAVGKKMAAWTRDAELIEVCVYRSLEADCIAAGVVIYRKRNHLTAVEERC